MVMMHTTFVRAASLEMYPTTEYAAALAKPVVGSSRKSTSGSDPIVGWMCLSVGERGVV